MRALSVPIAAAVALGLAFLVWDRLIAGLIFQPAPGVDLDPARYGAEEILLPTEDGVRVHAFWLPSEGASRALLFLHGNAGNASHRLPNAALLRDLGIHVLLLDYRGYGRSEGTPSEKGVYADARAGLAWLARKRGIPERRSVLFGRSLGGAVAVDLARGRDLAGVILESTFPSLGEAGRLHFGPLGALAGDRFGSRGKIGEVRAPLLFFHGDRDEVIAHDLGRRLYEAAPGPKDFVTLAGAGHNDTVEVGGRRYLERIRRFLDEVASPP